MTRLFLISSLLITAIAISGCGKVKLGKPAGLPGLKETYAKPTECVPQPKFQNGDIVKYKMLKDSYGIVMQCDYKYIPRLKTYYCIVDFYPTSRVHLEFSKFDNFERRYVYEYELKKLPQVPKKWSHLAQRE